MDGLLAWSPGYTLEAMEQLIILKAYSHFRNNKTATANSLGISIRTLDSKLEKYEDDARKQVERDAIERTAREDFLKRSRGIQQSINASDEEKEKQRASVFPGTTAGVRLESASQPSAQHAVPVSESKEVQKVLQPIHSSGGARRTR